MINREEWASRAACQREDPELWFPDRASDPRIDKALAICSDCPVAAACLAYAKRNGCDYGIWGGQLHGKDAQRRRMHNLPDSPQRDLQPCGTHAAYRRHLFHNEYPCLPCRAAAARDKQRRYYKRKADQ